MALTREKLVKRTIRKRRRNTNPNSKERSRQYSAKDLDQCNPQHEDDSGTNDWARLSHVKQTESYIYPGAILDKYDAWILVTAVFNGLLDDGYGFDQHEGWPPYGLSFIYKTLPNAGPSPGIAQTTFGPDFETTMVDVLTERGAYRVTSWVGRVGSGRRTPSEDPQMCLPRLQINLHCSSMAWANFRRIALDICTGIIDNAHTQSYVDLHERADADWIPTCPYGIEHWQKVSEHLDLKGLAAGQLRDRTETLLSWIEHRAIGHPAQHDPPCNENFTSQQDLTLLGIAFKLETPSVSLLEVGIKD